MLTKIIERPLDALSRMDGFITIPFTKSVYNGEQWIEYIVDIAGPTQDADGNTVPAQYPDTALGITVYDGTTYTVVKEPPADWQASSQMAGWIDHPIPEAEAAPEPVVEPAVEPAAIDQGDAVDAEVAQ